MRPALVALLLASGVPLAASAQPARGPRALVVGPAFSVVTASTPVNGALIVRGGDGGDIARVTVLDADGARVAGTFSERGTYPSPLYTFRPDLPWQQGTFTARVPLNIGDGTVDLPFEVGPPDGTPVVMPKVTADVSARTIERFLTCSQTVDGDVEESALVQRTTYVYLTLGPVDTADVNSSQLLYSPVIDGVELAGTTLTGPEDLTIQADPYLPSGCVRYQAFDPRGPSTWQGEDTCFTSALTPSVEHFEPGGALDEARCPYPEADFFDAWCAHNRTRCSAGVCRHYDAVCGTSFGRPVEVEDAGLADASAGEPAPSAERPEPRSAHDGGCSLGGSSHASGPLLAALAAWLLHRRRAPTGRRRRDGLRARGDSARGSRAGTCAPLPYARRG